MAGAPPPSTGEDPLFSFPLNHSSCPSIPVPPPKVSNNGNPLESFDSIREQQLPGGVGRVADSGSKGREMGMGGVGRIDGQEDVDGGDPKMGTDGGAAAEKLQQRKNLVAEGKRRNKTISKVSQGPDNRNEPPKPRLKKSNNNKGHLPIHSNSASPRDGSPMQVASSPGVKMLARTAAIKRASLMANSASIKRAKKAVSPESSHQSPSCTMTCPLPELPQVSPSLVDLSPGTRRTNSDVSKRKRRKLISAIWREALPIYRGRRLVEGRCIHCQQVFPASRASGTSHIKRHLKVCPSKAKMDEMVDKMGRLENSNGIDPNWKYDAKVARRKLVKLIVLNEMPFSLVEYPSFRQFVAALNPWFENVSRTTIRNECVAAHQEYGNELKEYFENFDSRISLTGDMWTSNQKLGYFCMTCHFISDEWLLHKRIIRFCMLETPHNSFNMFNVVLDSIQEWKLEDKLFSFTLDNASVNTAMINTLRENLKNKGFLYSKGKLLHFRCATHVFNIIVQDGLREVKSVVNNIRESMKYIKSSQARVEKFLGIIIQLGLSSRYRGPSVDVSTRWNSTFLMLRAAIPLRNAFSSLENHDKDYTFAPSHSEWKMAEDVCQLLEVFYTATVTLSGSSYPTSHLYFHQLWKIKKMLNKEEASQNKKILNKQASSQDLIIAHMVQQMQIKFNLYWKESYISACIPVVFDPRFKYDLLEYLLSDLGVKRRRPHGSVK